MLPIDLILNFCFNFFPLSISNFGIKLSRFGIGFGCVVAHTFVLTCLVLCFIFVLFVSLCCFFSFVPSRVCFEDMQVPNEQEIRGMLSIQIDGHILLVVGIL
jgi:cytochrome b subunit of formate dehydrogenase